MRLIFLDVDGVMNSGDFLYNRPEPRGGLLWRSEDWFDPAAVRRLNRIVYLSEAKVVISSSWRILHTVKEIIGFLKERGFTGEVIGKTPVIAGERGFEIRAYLHTLHEPPETFVVLDDSGDMSAVWDNFVQTDFSEGLVDRHVDRALAILLRGSRRLCICGHLELEHMLPEGDEARECVPARREYAVNDDDGFGWCACDDFSPKRNDV